MQFNIENWASLWLCKTPHTERECTLAAVQTTSSKLPRIIDFLSSAEQQWQWWRVNNSIIISHHASNEEQGDKKFHYQIRTTTRRQRGEFNRIYIGNSSVRDERSPQHFVLIINAQSTEKRKKPRENRYEKLIRLHSSSSLNITFTAHPERQQRKICVLWVHWRVHSLKTSSNISG